MNVIKYKTWISNNQKLNSKCLNSKIWFNQVNLITNLIGIESKWIEEMNNLNLSTVAEPIGNQYDVQPLTSLKLIKVD